MDENEEAGPVRRTRSAKAAKTPPVAKPVRQKPGPLSRRTRKKVVLMEVEVSDDEDETPQENKSALDAAEEEKKVEEKLLESPDESNDSVDQKSISAEKGKDSKPNKGDDDKRELNVNGQNSESVKLDDTVTVVFNDVEMLEEAEGETNTDENDPSKDSKVTEEKMEVDDEEPTEKPTIKTVEKEVATKGQTETQNLPKTDASEKEKSKLELSIKEKSEAETSKNDESKTETSKQDESKPECSKKKPEKEHETKVTEREVIETPKKEVSETRKKEVTETPKKDESETDKPKKDEPKKELLEKVAEAEKSEAAKSDKPKTDSPKKNEPKQETLKSVLEAEKPEAEQSVKPKTDIPKEVVVIIDKPKKAEEKKDLNEDKSSKVSEKVESKTDSTKKVETVPEKVEPKTTTSEDKPKETVPSKEVKPETTPDKVEPKTTADKVEPKTTADKVEPKTTSDKVEPKTTSDKAEPKTTSDRVEPKTTSDRVEPKTSDKVEPKTTSDKVEPKTTSDKVEPKTISDKVEPKTTSDKVEPKTTSDKVEPKTTSDKVEPKTTPDEIKSVTTSVKPTKSKNLGHEEPLAEEPDKKKFKPAVLADEKPNVEKVPEIQKSEPVKEDKIKEIKDEIKKEDGEEKVSLKEELKVEEPVSDKGKEEKVLVTEVIKMEVDETPAEKTPAGEIESSKDKLEEKKEADKTKPEDQVQKEVVEKEEKPVEAKQKGDPDAENISEDELPTLQAAKVPEAEEVSDEELPGPKRAELPADTEVVSEDELPTVKNEGKKEGVKRKLDATDYDPGSPTSENEAPAKKPSLEPSAEKEKEEKPVKAKKLPELDKYWKAVNDDPTDFTGWTYLLQYVDQENDMEAAREAYDAFLSHYPYCYGYWRKYADYEKRKGNKKKCEEVFERGLKAIPLSVDLWIHYLTYVKSTRADDEEFIRSQFERSILACGLEFRSDRLWDSFIKWETEGKRLQRVTAIYDRLLATPTQGYTSHFDNFQEHIASNPPNKVIEVDEFLALRKEVKHMLKHDITTDTAADDGDAPPGDDDPSKIVSSDEETKSIRERIVSIRRKLHKATVNAVTARWNYEEGIKRPYFHVKPLERCQLKNWQDYLDYETEQGDRVRIIVLFERCLIACALYEEFWLKFVHYLEGLKDKEMQPKIRDVYERACTIHHLKKPGLHLQWAMFEEEVENANRAAEILVNLEKSVPNILQIAYRRINLERRRNDHEKCCQLYEHYINNSKNKMISSNIAIKYSRFCFRVMKDIAKAQEALKTAISKDPNNPRLYLQLIDLALQKENVSQAEVIEVIDSFLDKDSTDIEQKVLFAQRKLEYVEDFGCDVQSVQLAYDQYQKILKQGKDSIKKKEVKSEPTASSKKEKPTTQSSSQSSTYNYGAYGNSSAQPSYPYSGSQQQGQNYYQQYGQGGDQYQYQNWQYPQGGYGGYNQWGGYSGGYGY